MTKMYSRVDRRQFGRRLTSLNGWLQPVKGVQIPCIVRNIAEVGAFLEGDFPKLQQDLTLVVPAFDLQVPCQVRRQVTGGVGVSFPIHITLPDGMPRRIEPSANDHV